MKEGGWKLYFQIYKRRGIQGGVTHNRLTHTAWGCHYLVPSCLLETSIISDDGQNLQKLPLKCLLQS